VEQLAHEAVADRVSLAAQLVGEVAQAGYSVPVLYVPLIAEGRRTAVVDDAVGRATRWVAGRIDRVLGLALLPRIRKAR
jgi:hypothetical protein